MAAGGWGETAASLHIMDTCLNVDRARTVGRARTGARSRVWHDTQFFFAGLGVNPRLLFSNDRHNGRPRPHGCGDAAMRSRNLRVRHVSPPQVAIF